MVEDNLVVGVKLDKSSSIRPVIPVSMLKPIGSPFGRNGNYLVPRNWQRSPLLMCGDQHLSKPLTAENIMVPLQIILADALTIIYFT